MTYDNRDRGALFKNDRKDSDDHPDYRGNINVGGHEFWLSAWIKTSKTGTKFMSLSVRPKDQVERQEPRRQERTYDQRRDYVEDRRPAAAQPQSRAPQRNVDFDDEISF